MVVDRAILISAEHGWSPLQSAYIAYGSGLGQAGFMSRDDLMTVGTTLIE